MSHETNETKNIDKIPKNIWQSSFSLTHKVGNVGIIANSAFTHIRSFLLYLYKLILVNVKLEIKGYMKNILDLLHFNSTAKTMLAMLAFLYCGVIVKNSI